MTSCLLILTLLLPGIDVNALTAGLHVETGMAFIEQGLHDKALAEFNSALEMSEEAYEAHLGLARIAAINSSFATAEEEYSIYMNYKPDDYRAPLEMSKMLLSLRGRSYDALDYAEKALELSPLNAFCWLAIADSEASLGNIENAVGWYSRIIIENEELADEARIRMGSLFFVQGNLADAREILLPAANSGREEAHRILALIYNEQHDSLRAIDSINRYLFLVPNGVWADSARVLLEELSSISTPTVIN